VYHAGIGSSMEGIRISLIDKDNQFRDRVSYLIDSQTDMYCIASLSSIKECDSLECLNESYILLIDHRCLFSDELHFISSIRAKYPKLKIIIFVDEETSTNDMFSYYKHGAIGTIDRDISKGQFISSLRNISMGLPQIMPELADRILYYFNPSPFYKNERVVLHLETKELIILRFLSESLPIQEIAKQLYITQDLVKAFILRVMNKLYLNYNYKTSDTVIS